MSQTTEAKSDHVKKTGGNGRLIVAGIAVVLLVAATRFYDLPGLLARPMNWVAAQGLTGVAVFILLYVLACVFFVPGSVLTLGAGAVWGVVGGVPVVSVASNLGATAAFLVGLTRPSPAFPFTACAKAARGTWARFLKKVFAADPLVCPDCHGSMRIVAFIGEPRVVRAILEHLSLWDAPRRRPPPVAAVGPADFAYVPCED